MNSTTREMKMNVKYEKKDALTFIGFHKSIKEEDGYSECPKFWQESYVQRFAHLFQTQQPQDALEKAVLDHKIGAFGICENKGDSFDYWIAGLYHGGEVPEGLEIFQYPARTWALFSIKGPLPDSLQKLNTEIWQEWYPTSGKQKRIDSSIMLEVYSEGDNQSLDYECGIWIPLKRC